jgi:hypothetical protein
MWCYACEKPKFLLSKEPSIGSSLLFVCGATHVKSLSFCWVRDHWLRAPCFLYVVLRMWRTGEGDQSGGEWEQIKISRRKLAYISNQTRCPSLLTWPGPHSYRTAIDPQNRVRNRSRNMNRCQQEHVVDAFGKSPRKSDLNHESSSLLIRWLKSYTNISLQQFIHGIAQHNKNQIGR